jgi:UDP-N-acetylglucosamine--N-acetylmuramyl-(pentapeptide) pyrophosphoryl-undecaprenol N-acetylglucosamine transferase
MRWLIAAGGTGGHVFPALALAEALGMLDPGGRLLFVGTPRGLECRVVPAKGYDLRTIHISGLVGMGLLKTLQAGLTMPVAFLECLWILAAFRPHLVVGMGGYAAGPVVLLASLLGLPTAIAEQNAVAGRTNRILGRVARRVFLSFPESAGAFPPGKVRLTGNPVRSELVEQSDEARPPSWEAGQPLHLLIFGGSQGARGINKAVVESLPQLAELPSPLEVRHQAAPDDIEELRSAYTRWGIPHRLFAFIEEMDQAYLWAHLVICRAGATSLAELALFQRPSILVPYPFAADDHQMHNAEVFQRAGAALVFPQRELTGELLAAAVRGLMEDPQRLRRMGACAGSLARPRAAEEMARECLALARGKEGGAERR